MPDAGPHANVVCLPRRPQSAGGPGPHLRILQAVGRDPAAAEAVLCEFGNYPLDARPQAYAIEFEAWLFEAIRTAQEGDLINYRSRAPHSARNHPTEDHIWPLFVPLGAAGKGATGGRLYEGYTYGILSMAAYAWGL